tara:strand:+ start:3547 stop:5094 length:1548 start_codon:yes stop_codon:yes gene_type:complete
MSEFVPALSEHNDARSKREPLADIKDDFKGFQPTKGFTRSDLAKKQFARDLAMTVKHRPRVQKKRQPCQLHDTDDNHIDVRKFHNSVKNGVYSLGFSYAGLENPRYKFPCLLELSCGRGGDMFKWKKNGYKNVVAVDNDHDALEEARSRFKTNDMRPLRVRYEHVDLTKGDLVAKLSEKKLGTTFDTVSIQFAIQYMCSTTVLELFLQNVATLVRPGGTFIGTYPCGKEIVNLLGTSSEFDNGFLKIRESQTGPGIQFYANFGESKSYFDEFGTSEEFPVSFSTISGILENLGFVLVENTGFLETRELGNYILTDSEKQFSGVFKTFVFQKRDVTSFFPPKNGLNWDSLKIDKVGKYSVTRPRDAAILHRVIKEYVDSDTRTVCDGTACVGGDTIHFSANFEKVFAWELDRERYEYLTNNIKVYGIENVETINASIVKSSGECDLLYLDPPWGGPEYKNADKTELYLDGINIKQLIPGFKKRFRQIVIKIPYNYNILGSEMIIKISEKVNVWFVR